MNESKKNAIIHTNNHPSLAESIHCFRANLTHNRNQNNQPGTTNTTRSRAKYTEQVKEKVLGVRRQGACLRCRMLKIECSLQNPCEACLQSAVKGTERKVLSFSYCVRTRFADVNIFQSLHQQQQDKMRTDTMMLKMSSLLSRIAVPASFSFISGSEFDSTKFNKAMTCWLTDPKFDLASSLGPNGSIVGMCCSNLLALQFQEENNSDLDELTADFQRFLLAASVSHTGSYPNFTDGSGMKPGEICTAGHMSGSRLLLRLDRTLTPQYLSKLSKSSCQVLFLFVLGAVLGMGYSSSPDLRHHYSPAFPSDMLMNSDFKQSPTLWLTMRDHLCQMLAHHLIYLGGMLGIKLDTEVERRIIESAGRGWGKTLPESGGYVWGEGMVQESDIRPTSAFDKRNNKTCSPTMAEHPPPSPLPAAWNYSPKSEIEYTPPSSPLAPPHSPLVPIACGPELSHFHSQNQTWTQDWDQNPSSYLDMEYEEPENYCPPPYSPVEESREVHMEKKMMPAYGRSNTEPYYNYTHEQRHQGYGVPRETKRRTMWIVRTVDAGPPYGAINVHARLRGGRDLEGLRSFV